eukprot:GDKI01020896.1.p2 GENE.GDKI01020896.1~~GDKI01020896.1.p2  ORF type:complete len:103 (+),score=37.56 GDKI01020896.1:1-309(+)
MGGDGLPKSVAFPHVTGDSAEPGTVWTVRGGVRVLSLKTLIELKLASGISAPHRVKDLGDVEQLINANQLPSEFGEQLDLSVRAAFKELWDKVQEGRKKSLL